jgi:Common central domain of tyrosinase
LVHNAVGGTMATAASPADPLFWLHHAFVDRLWARWQASPQGASPSNVNERLLPARVFGFPLFGNRVSSVLDIRALGYEYA